MVSIVENFLLGFLLVLVYGGIWVNSETEKNVTIFVFGDSIFDAGNNNYMNITSDAKANRWPYGETFFNFSTGRYCDGRVIPDFIAISASLPPWKPFLELNGTQKSFIHGANFAAGGAHVIAENNPGWINLKDQLNFFKNATKVLMEEVGEEEAGKILRKAVYLTSIGGDDYATYLGDYANSTESQLQEYIKLVIGNITEVIKEIYEIGGRKFAFQNIGPMGCTTQALQDYDVPSGECYEYLNEMMQQHNDAFLVTAKELENELQGFKYLVFDYYTILYDMSIKPSQYGFKVADVACCGSGRNNGYNCGIVPFELCNDPNEYVFWDGDHAGDRANILLSQLLWSGDSTYTSPMNFKQLLELQIPSNASLGNFVADNTSVELM